MKPKIKPRFCKRVKFFSGSNHESPSVVLGIILSETDDFIVLRTGRKEMTLNRRYIVSIENTNAIFREVKIDDRGRDT